MIILGVVRHITENMSKDFASTYKQKAAKWKIFSFSAKQKNVCCMLAEFQFQRLLNELKFQTLIRIFLSLMK